MTDPTTEQDPDLFKDGVDDAHDALGEAVSGLDLALIHCPDAETKQQLEALLDAVHDAYVALGELHFNHWPNDWAEVVEDDA